MVQIKALKLKAEVIGLTRDIYETIDFLEEFLNEPKNYHPELINETQVQEALDLLEMTREALDGLMNDTDFDVSSPNIIETLNDVKEQQTSVHQDLLKLEFLVTDGNPREHPSTKFDFMENFDD